MHERALKLKRRFLIVVQTRFCLERSLQYSKERGEREYSHIMFNFLCIVQLIQQTWLKLDSVILISFFS